MNDRQWTDVARVTNLAEAGFLTDELVGHGIDAEFTKWRNSVRSPIVGPQCISSACRANRRQPLRPGFANSWPRTAAEAERESGEFRFSHDGRVGRPDVLAASRAGGAGRRGELRAGAAFFGSTGQANAAAQFAVLGNRSIGRPLMTEPAPGKPRHRFLFDRRRRDVESGHRPRRRRPVR